ncbi:MAG: DUF222 domain-containing protein [Actinomycetota bacterium]
MFTAEHERLSALDPHGLSRPELLGVIDELYRLEKRAEERRLAFTAAIDELADSGADAATVTRSITHASARQAKKTATAASALRQMPRMAEALAQGKIGSEHAQAATAAAEATSPEAADTLASRAAELPADLFAKQARTWTNRRLRNEQKEARRQRQLAAREANWWTTDDGMTHLHAVFDGEAGRRAVKALDKHVDRLWREDGGRDGSPDEVRSSAQRRLDALVHLIAPPAEAEAEASEPLAEAGRPHPRHMVIIHLDARTGEAEFTEGEPVPASLLMDLGPAAEVVGIVYGTDGQPLYLGRSRRLASRQQWIALIDRDRGCVRCGADPSRCEAHHPTEFGDGGPTDIDNLELLCHHDHSLAHRHRTDRRRRPAEPRAA